MAQERQSAGQRAAYGDRNARRRMGRIPIPASEAAYPASDPDLAAKYWPPVSRIDNVARGPQSRLLVPSGGGVYRRRGRIAARVAGCWPAALPRTERSGDDDSLGACSRLICQVRALRTPVQSLSKDILPRGEHAPHRLRQLPVDRRIAGTAKLLISPLAGQISGRTEGGAKEHLGS